MRGLRPAKTGRRLMRLRPPNLEELRHALATANARGVPVTGWDLHALNTLIAHRPEDMTATVEAGMPLAELQQTLARQNQWLPLDPPFPTKTTIGALLAGNHSGPRRFGFGTVRDWLIGIRVVLADGKIVKAGGQVVKNVAGFDLCKLFVGSHGTLGIIVEATFKLLPQPQAECFLQRTCVTLQEAAALLEQIWKSSLQPSVLDLHRLPNAPLTLVVGLSGPTEDVTAQRATLATLGVRDETNLSYDAVFHTLPSRKLTVAPSAVISTLEQLGATSFVARAGNGVIAHASGVATPANLPSPVLQQRVKDAFDPKHTFPSL